jgi:hypothetical protein
MCKLLFDAVKRRAEHGVDPHPFKSLAGRVALLRSVRCRTPSLARRVRIAHHFYELRFHPGPDQRT